MRLIFGFVFLHLFIAPILSYKSKDEAGFQEAETRAYGAIEAWFRQKNLLADTGDTAPERDELPKPFAPQTTCTFEYGGPGEILDQNIIPNEEELSALLSILKKSHLLVRKFHIKYFAFEFKNPDLKNVIGIQLLCEPVPWQDRDIYKSLVTKLKEKKLIDEKAPPSVTNIEGTSNPAGHVIVQYEHAILGLSDSKFIESKFAAILAMLRNWHVEFVKTLHYDAYTEYNRKGKTYVEKMKISFYCSKLDPSQWTEVNSLKQFLVSQKFADESLEVLPNLKYTPPSLEKVNVKCKLELKKDTSSLDGVQSNEGRILWALHVNLVEKVLQFKIEMANAEESSRYTDFMNLEMVCIRRPPSILNPLVKKLQESTGTFSSGYVAKPLPENFFSYTHSSITTPDNQFSIYWNPSTRKEITDEKLFEEPRDLVAYLNQEQSVHSIEKIYLRVSPVSGPEIPDEYQFILICTEAKKLTNLFGLI